MNRYWVADASPIILLGKALRPSLLSDCAEELLIPEVVSAEVRQGPTEDSARAWIEKEGTGFMEAAGPTETNVAAWDLGRGESRVLSAAYRRDERFRLSTRTRQKWTS